MNEAASEMKTYLLSDILIEVEGGRIQDEPLLALDLIL